MKIRVRQNFKYTWDNVVTHTLYPGEYEVPQQVDQRTAALAIEFGKAIIVPARMVEKKAPEDKAIRPESKKSKR